MMGVLLRVRNAQINSSVARSVLSYYYNDGEIYTLPFGPLRGCRLRYQGKINYHAMLGLWELDNFRFLTKVLLKGNLVARDAIVCDVGANIGMFSLWLARRCVPNGTVFAFEPAPDTRDILRDTVAINNVENVHVEPFACTDRPGSVEFFIGFHHHVSSLDEKWAASGQKPVTKIVVDGVTLDDFFYGDVQRRAPAFIKLDIEGGAVYALKGCDRCAGEARSFFLVESHNPAEDLSLSKLILRYDYKAFRITNQRWVADPTTTYPNPDGVWGTLFLCPVERYADVAILVR